MYSGTRKEVNQPCSLRNAKLLIKTNERNNWQVKYCPTMISSRNRDGRTGLSRVRTWSQSTSSPIDSLLFLKTQSILFKMVKRQRTSAFHHWSISSGLLSKSVQSVPKSFVAQIAYAKLWTHEKVVRSLKYIRLTVLHRVSCWTSKPVVVKILSIDWKNGK